MVLTARADKRPATIIETHPHHAFALDDAGFRYFIYRNAVSTVGAYGFDDLRAGSIVNLLPIEHPRGPRGIEVEIVEC